MRVVHQPDRVNQRAITTLFVLMVKALGERAIGLGVNESVASRWGRPPEDLNAIEMNLFEPRTASEHEAAKGVFSAARTGQSAMQRLHGYGWSDRQRGTVHIPIDRAMLLYLAQEKPGPLPPSTPSRGDSALRPHGGGSTP
jgi:hypothetical protein